MRQIKILGRFRRQCFQIVALAMLLLPVFLRFSVPPGLGAEGDLSIIGFYSCDESGDPLYYFPRRTLACFNVSIRNAALDPINASVYLTVQDVNEVPLSSDQLDTTIPPNVSVHYIMSVLLPKWAYVGPATAYVSVRVGGISVDSNSTEFYIGPEDLTSPIVHILSPENKTYDTTPVSLAFTVNERVSWIGYVLDNRQNVTIGGNVTLSDLDNGSHKILVYADDRSGNTGMSQEVDFSVMVTHDVALVDLRCSPTEVYVGQDVNVILAVQNQGTMPETFDVIVYANTSMLHAFVVNDLQRSGEAILVFVWNTTDCTRGEYVITVYVPPIPQEDDTADNTLVGENVNIMLRPDIAITNITASRTWVGQGNSAMINVTIMNQGGDIESFNVTIYANTTMIVKIENISLATSSSKTIGETWDTTGFAFGNYTVSAYVEPLLDEVDTSDNNFTDGCVLVSILGDVVGPPDSMGQPDGKVDMRDIDAICCNFGTTPFHPNWDLNLDLNEDGVVNMRDVFIAIANFGRHI